MFAMSMEHMRSMHLSLDMSRGKPGFDNMDLSEKCSTLWEMYRL